MRHSILTSLIGAIVLIGSFGCATRPDQCEQLHSTVQEMLPQHLGETCINDDDWAKMLKVISVPQSLTKCSLLGADGKLNRDSVVKSFGLEPCKELSYKIYLEASGSMKSYDDPSIEKGLRAVVRQFYSRLDSHNIGLYWVSDKVYPADGDISAALKSLNDGLYKAATDKDIPAKQTLFKDIFTSVLGDLKDDELALVVSDMLYSRKGQTNPVKVADEAENSMDVVFKNVSKNYDLLIVQFYGKYNGWYYTYLDERAGEKPYVGMRPYYFLLIGRKEVMAELTSFKNYLSEWQSYPEGAFQNKFLFRSFSDTSARYCYLSQSSDCQGRFKEGSTIEGLKSNSRSGGNSIYVGVNLSDVYADNEYLKDIANYELGDNPEFELKEVLTNEEFKALGGPGKLDKSVWNDVKPTHVLKLNMLVVKATNQSELTIQLKQRFPKWVTNATSPDDTDLSGPKFSTTTFALKEMMSGLFKAYYKSDDPTIKSFTIKFKD